MSVLRLLTLIALVVCVAHTAPAQDPTVINRSMQPAQAAIELQVDDPTVLQQLEIGVPLRVRITVPGGGEIESVTLEFPEDQQPKVHVGGMRKTGPASFEISLRPLSAGEYELGPATAIVRAAGSESDIRIPTNSLMVSVAPPAGEPAMEELRSYTGPLAIPFDYTWRNVVIASAVVLLLLIAALLIAWIVYKVSRRQAEAAIVPVLPPVESALLAVRGLASLDVYRMEGSNKHYTMLSTALRRYLEDQFDVNAVEMTEDEVVDLLRNRLDRIPRTPELAEIMQRSSLAKFANMPLTEELAQQDCLSAERFLVGEKERIEDERRRLAQHAQEGRAA